MKQLVVCADDYAQDASVSSAIVQLIAQQRVTATSVMTLSPRWPQDAAPLRELREQADVGLHLDFTSSFAQAAGCGMGLSRAMAMSALGLLSTEKMRTHIARQLDAFEQHWGAPPDHVDGHQHVHQFDGVRQALVQICKARYGKRLPWVRCSQPSYASAGLKGCVIAAWGAKALQRGAVRAGVPHSQALLGVYGFEAQPGLYAQRMKQWLAQVSSTGRDLLMCHPAVGAEPSDAINPARQLEHAYLASDAFAQDLADAHCTLVRGSSWKPQA